MPAARARDPKAAPARGAAWAKTSWARAAEPVRTKMPTLAARWLVVWKSSPDRLDPRERNRPAIDHEETAARAASMNGPRIEDGTWGRCGVSDARVRVATGSGIRQTPAKATANSRKS